MNSVRPFDLLGLCLAFMSGLPFAFAGDCDPIRLDQTTPDGRAGSMIRVPVQDQGKLDICYSMTMAQLVDAYRFSHGDPRLPATSAFEAAVGHVVTNTEEYLRRKKRDDPDELLFENGQICKTFRYVQGAGACTQTFIPPENYTKKSTDDSPDAAYGRILQFSRPLDSFSWGPTDCNRPPASIWDIPVSEDVLRLAVQVASQSDLTLLKEKVVDVCTQKGRVPLSPTLTCTSEAKLLKPLKLTSSLTRHLIDERLDQPYPAQPVGIAYCSAFLWNGRANLPKTCEEHSSLVIGREKQNGKCMYLLRNSLGTSCNRYHPDWKANCENGNIWVEADYLSRKIWDITYLSERTP